MIRSVKIEGYRALRKLSMEKLGRITLIVGRNNTGKTSVLEALYLLATYGDPQAIWRVMGHRGEQMVPESIPGRGVQPELDICHLFYNHALTPGTKAVVQTTNEAPDRFISFEVKEARREENPALFAQLPQEIDGALSPRLAIAVTGHPQPLTSLIPLSNRGSFRNDTVQLLTNIAASSPRFDTSRNQYIPSESLSLHEVQAAFNSISLSPREDLVVEALRYLEPRVERIAIAPIGPIFYSSGQVMRGGFKVKLSGSAEPIPIGSSGEGTWRMLALAITLSRCKDGLLFIDEIDTGLHYTVMDRMWQFLAGVARDFNVQVFATTHSQDCINSLASISDAEGSSGNEITIQRIEPDQERTVSYSEPEVRALAQKHIEAR